MKQSDLFLLGLLRHIPEPEPEELPEDEEPAEIGDDDDDAR